MGYIDSNLLPDETIIFRTKKHPIVFAVPVIFLLLALFFCTDNSFTNHINNALFLVTRHIPRLENIHRIPALIFTFGLIISGIQQWVLYQMSEYVVTNKRVVMREGLLDRRTSDMRLTTIASVSIDQGILAQLLNYGNISINGFGGQRDDFMQVADPASFQKSVHVQIEK
jgi:uncharacterized membrane protein YdbT with pleckstrin-like domain